MDIKLKVKVTKEVKVFTTSMNYYQSYMKKHHPKSYATVNYYKEVEGNITTNYRFLSAQADLKGWQGKIGNLSKYDPDVSYIEGITVYKLNINGHDIWELDTMGEHLLEFIPDLADHEEYVLSEEECNLFEVLYGVNLKKLIMKEGLV